VNIFQFLAATAAVTTVSLIISPSKTIVVLFGFALVGLIMTKTFKNPMNLNGSRQVLSFQNYNNLVVESMLDPVENKVYALNSIFCPQLQLGIRNYLTYWSNIVSFQSFPRIGYETFFLIVIVASGSSVLLSHKSSIAETVAVIFCLLRCVPYLQGIMNGILVLSSSQYALKRVQNFIKKSTDTDFAAANAFVVFNQSSPDNPNLLVETEGLILAPGGLNVTAISPFFVEVGDVFLIKGPSGSGKSTLIKIILGFCPPRSGHLTIYGYSSQKEFMLNLSYQSQFPSILPMSLRDNITVGREVDPQDLDNVIRALNLSSLDDRYNHAPLDSRQLSGGEKQRIGLARAAVVRSDILILDEPTNNLDKQTKEWVVSFIKQKPLAQTVFIISHDPFLDQLYPKGIDLLDVVD